MGISGRIIVIGFVLLRAACGQNTAVIDQLMEASKIPNDSLRLYTYDQIIRNSRVKETGSEDHSEPISTPGSQWVVTTDTNPIDDSKVIFFALRADEATSKFRKPVGLLIRYSSKKTEVYVSWNDYLGSEAYVTMRIGDEKAETFRWGLSTDNTATFYPRNCISLINKMINVDRVVFRCTPYNESPVTAIFDVRGLKEEADKYMSDLRWW